MARCLCRTTTPAPSIASRMASRRRGSVRWRLIASAPAVLGAIMLCANSVRAQTLQDKLAACTACHGETGQSPNPEIPSIGGQPKLFVMYQLFFYREGRRQNPEMNAIAKELSDAELSAVSDFVAKLPPPPALADPSIDRARYLRGAELASK